MNNEPDASLRRERVKSAPGGRVLWAPGKERGEREAYCAIETPHSTEQHLHKCSTHSVRPSPDGKGRHKQDDTFGVWPKTFSYTMRYVSNPYRISGAGGMNMDYSPLYRVEKQFKSNFQAKKKKGLLKVDENLGLKVGS